MKGARLTKKEEKAKKVVEGFINTQYRDVNSTLQNYVGFDLGRLGYDINANNKYKVG
jgi:hypothetical protein